MHGEKTSWTLFQCWNYLGASFCGGFEFWFTTKRRTKFWKVPLYKMEPTSLFFNFLQVGTEKSIISSKGTCAKIVPVVYWFQNTDVKIYHVPLFRNRSKYSLWHYCIVLEYIWSSPLNIYGYNDKYGWKTIHSVPWFYLQVPLPGFWVSI